MKYTVKAGDSLSGIARQFYGDPAKYTLIAEANDIDDINRIQVGSSLDIPGFVESPANDESQLSGSDAFITAGITASQLQAIMPAMRDADASRFSSPLSSGMLTSNINTSLRQAHFIAQLAHESGSFKWLSENLNYSANALQTVFGKYFTTEDSARSYARQPESIANRVYANRMGNGPESSGDGWRYRGRGLIQLTGRENYQKLSDSCSTDYVRRPELLESEPEDAVRAACWFWDSRNLNQYADQDDLRAITRRINGGYNGIEERQQFLESAKSVLGI